LFGLKVVSIALATSVDESLAGPCLGVVVVPGEIAVAESGVGWSFAYGYLLTAEVAVAGVQTFFLALEVVSITATAPVDELLACSRDIIVVVLLEVSLAKSCVCWPLTNG